MRQSIFLLFLLGWLTACDPGSKSGSEVVDDPLEIRYSEFKDSEANFRSGLAERWDRKFAPDVYHRFAHNRPYGESRAASPTTIY